MRLAANGIEIEVDDRGNAGDEPLVMVMGLGMQLIGWPDELVQSLVSRGFRVIRFDNRDIGLSQHLDHLGVPNLPWTLMRMALGLPVHSPYTLADMARDTLGVLDGLNLQRAHVVGASMGGMIAQHVAAKFPERVKSLTLIMTTSGSRSLPQARMPVRRTLISRPDSQEVDVVAAHLERVLKVIGSPAYPPDPNRLRERVEAMARRSWHPAGTARQMLAVAADGDRSALLPGIHAPTHVIHGESDVLVPSEAGRDLAAKIPGATLDMIPGMGHDLPLALFERFVAGIATNAARAS